MSGDEQVVVGRVAGEPGTPIAVRAVMTIDGEQVARRDCAESLVLETDDGAIEVTLDVGDGPERALKGSWAEVGATPLGKMFLDHAPGDHIDVAIAGHAIFAGDLVAVRGVVAETAASGGGYREAPEQRITAIRASRAAAADTEDEARAALDSELAAADDESRAYQARLEKMHRAEEAAKERRAKRARREREESPGPPWRWRTIIAAVLAVGATAAGAAMALGWRGLVPANVEALIAFGAGVALVEIAIWGFVTRFDLPVAFTAPGAPPTERRDYQNAVKLHLIVAAVGVGLAVNTKNNIWLLLLALLPVANTLLRLWRQRQSLRALRLVGAADSLDADRSDGSWGVVRGRVTLGSLEATAVRTAHARSETRTERTEDGGTREVTTTNRWDQIKINQRPTDLVVELEGGDRLEVQTRHGQWAAAFRWQPITSKQKSRRAIARIGEGDQVRVLGRVRAADDGWVVKATGPESLFVVAGSPLRLALWRLTPVFCQLAYAGAIAALALIRV